MNNKDFVLNEWIDKDINLTNMTEKKLTPIIKKAVNSWEKANNS